jgi:hypothetical protein
MATSINCGFAFWMDGGTYNGVLGRTYDVAASWFSSGAAQVFGGVIPSGGALQVTAGSGLSVNVATGFCIVPSSSGSLYGGYQFGLMSAGSLSIAAADATNPRVDLVCATVIDDGNSSSSTLIQVIEGIPAASPAAPSLPPSSIPLAYVTVPANAASIVSGDISDKRVFTTGVGGIMPVPSLTSIPSGYTGMYLHDRTTGRLVHNPSSGPAQPHILPYAPAINAKTANVVNSGSETTVLSLSFTSDGVTDWEFLASWPGIAASSAGGIPLGATMRLKLDGTQISTKYVWNEANDGTPRGGADINHATSGLLGDTPSAGSHTLAWTFIQNYSGSINISIIGASYAPIVLRAKPVVL